MLNKTINGYTIKHKLGEGGMAEVWYAENKIDKPAAVKILNPDLSLNAPIVERFLNEAKIMVKLTHPNIRQVYDYDEIDGRPCIIMEYLEGEDLKAMVKRHGALDSGTAANYWNQIVVALNYTHGKGVVHRDIKPSNIFVTNEGQVKLLDFGIAKVRDAVTGTQTGQKLGTLVYMSPEQITDSKHVDNRTDIYSLAVTFVHLLTGRVPYDTDSSSDFKIMKQIVEHPLNMTGVPSEWQAFLVPYLEKEPRKRPELQEFETTKSTPNYNKDHTFIEESQSQKKANPETCDSTKSVSKTKGKTAVSNSSEPNLSKVNIHKHKWLLISIIVAGLALIGLDFFFSQNTILEVNDMEFLQMVKNQEIEHVGYVKNNSHINIYLKKSALEHNPKHKEVKNNIDGPQYYIVISDFQVYSENLRDAKAMYVQERIAQDSTLVVVADVIAREYDFPTKKDSWTIFYQRPF